MARPGPLPAAAARQTDRQPPPEHGRVLAREWGRCDSTQVAMRPSPTGDKEDWGLWGSVVQCKIRAPPVQLGRRSPDGRSRRVLQGKPCWHQRLLHLQPFSRGPFSKNAECGTAFVPQQRTEMSLKQNPSSQQLNRLNSGGCSGRTC